MKMHRAFLNFMGAEVKISTTDPDVITELKKRIGTEGQLVNVGTEQRPDFRDNCRYCRAVILDRDVKSGAAAHGLCDGCYQEGR